MDLNYNWFGLDFGTTNSAAFSFTGINRERIEPIHYGDDEGRPFPSIVAINKETGEVITGREAKENKNSLLETHEYFHSIKSILDSDQEWNIAGKIWKPEDIAAEILKALKLRIERGNANIIDEVVMAVPVGYSAAKKKHLRSAADKAGIKIKMFISEPTAAFCSNYNALRGCNNIAVFDWGGGTLDVVILNISKGQISELSSEGMNFAGNDIDLKLAEKMHLKFMKTRTPVVAFNDMDSRSKDQLITKCERAKCDFEDEDVVSISINKYGDYGAVRDSMEYDYFSLLLEPDVDKAIGCLDRAIKTAGLNATNIDRILCVGGSSKLRPLKEEIEKQYGEDKVLYPDEVMWDIAKGAAFLATRPGAYQLSKSIGLQLCDGSYYPLINKGQKIPCKENSLMFSIVDQGENIKSARFIFTDSDTGDDRELFEPVNIPLRGFVDEYVYLSCYVDEDNVFKARIGSNRKADSCDKVWNYEKLKVSFHVEESK